MHRPQTWATTLMLVLFTTALAAGQQPATTRTTAPSNAATQPMEPATQPADAAADPPPEKAIVLDLRKRYVPDDNGGQQFTVAQCFGQDIVNGAFARFSVNSPGELHSWYAYIDLPIDVRRYPIVVTRYRMRSAQVDKQWYGVWMSDATDAITGGFHPLLKEDLISDGKVHEVRKDSRKFEHQIAGPTGVMIVQLFCSQKGPAEFDLLDMRFEAVPEAPNPPVAQDPAVKVRVIGPDNAPVVGAKVIVDAERRNFMRSGVSDENGIATITPLSNESGRHALDVQVPGRMSEHALFSGAEFTLQLQPGSYYGGTVLNPRGQPVPGVMVAVRSQKNTPDGQQTPLEYSVMTDSAGRWRSPSLPSDPDAVKLELVYHPTPGAPVQRQGIATGVEAIQADSPDLLDKKLGGGGEAAAEAGAHLMTVHPVEGEPVRGTLRKLDAGRLTIQPPNANEQVIALDGIADLTRSADAPRAATAPGQSQVNVADPAAAGGTATGVPTTGEAPIDSQPSAVLKLAGDDQLAGPVLAWSEKAIRVRAAGQELEVPLDRIREVWTGSAEQVAKARAVLTAAATDDTALVMKDEQVLAVHGVALGLSEGSLMFRYNDADRKISLAKLIGVVLAGRDDAKTNDMFHQVVRFGAGDVLSGRWVELGSDGVLVLRMPWGSTLKLPMSQVSRIDCRNGRVVYLSDRKPIKVEQIPYFDRLVPWRNDASLTGGPILLGDGPYAKGISVHSRCVLEYDVGGKFQQFRAKLGFQQPEGKTGRAAVRVLGDGKVLYEQADARGEQPPADVNVNLAGIARLTLEVDFGKNEDVGDHVVWADARVVRASIPAGQ